MSFPNYLRIVCADTIDLRILTSFPARLLNVTALTDDRELSSIIYYNPRPPYALTVFLPRPLPRRTHVTLSAPLTGSCPRGGGFSARHHEGSSCSRFCRYRKCFPTYMQVNV